jgi:FtsH-binding integral membrane protein
MDTEHQIPIWFFIGALLLVYGLLITGSGIYGLFHPPEREVALSQLHAGLWWGLLLFGLGLFYVVRFRPSRQRRSASGPASGKRQAPSS